MTTPTTTLARMLIYPREQSATRSDGQVFGYRAVHRLNRGSRTIDPARNRGLSRRSEVTRNGG
jgi:hypothetical protein